MNANKNMTSENAKALLSLLERVPNIGNVLVKFDGDGRYVVAIHHEERPSSESLAEMTIAAIKVALRSKGLCDEADRIDRKHLEFGDCAKVEDAYTVIWCKI